MSEQLPFGIDPGLIGNEFDSSTSEAVTAREIHDYAESLGETHPAFFAPEPIDRISPGQRGQPAGQRTAIRQAQPAEAGRVRLDSHPAVTDRVEAVEQREQ